MTYVKQRKPFTLEIRPLTLESLSSKLYSRTVFQLSRWGDGELGALFNEKGHNCDGHKYFREMGLELYDALIYQAQGYYHGILPCGIRAYGEELNELMDTIHPEPALFDGMAILKANRTRKLLPLLHELRKRKVLYIGPHRIMQTTLDMIHWRSFIGIREQNCYLDINKIQSGICKEIDSFRPDVLCFSAGMTTNILIYRLLVSRHDNLTMLDMGSIFDPYSGKLSRKYMNGYDWDDLRNYYVKN